MLRRARESYFYGGQLIAKGDEIEMPEGATRIRLKVPCFFNNHRHDQGDVIELPKDVAGPHKSRAVSQDKIDYGTDPSIDANRILGEVALDPQFDVIEHDDVEEEKPEGDGDAPAGLLEKPDAEKSAAADEVIHPADQSS